MVLRYRVVAPLAVASGPLFVEFNTSVFLLAFQPLAENCDGHALSFPPPISKQPTLGTYNFMRILLKPLRLNPNKLQSGWKTPNGQEACNSVPLPGSERI